MGTFCDDVFLPTLKKLVETSKSYEVKRLVKVPTTWGAKNTGEQFLERASKVIKGGSTCLKSRRVRRRPA